MQAALQTALFARLNGASLGATVVDFVPEADNTGDNSRYPLISIGRILLTQDDTMDKNGGDFICRIHTHTRGGSMLACKEIQDAIYAALHRQELNPVGYNNYSLLRNDTDCRHEGDGKVRGICEYRGLIQAG